MNSSDDLSVLAAYFEEYRADPLVQNVGLVAGENLRGFGAVRPASWFSLAKVEEAKSTKRDITVADVSGGRVVALGTKQKVGGRQFNAGDQIFYQPASKTVAATKTYAQTKAEALKESGVGPSGTVREKTGNLAQIARAFGIDIPVASPYGADIRDVWLYLGRTFRVSGTTQPVPGDAWSVYVDPSALANLRVRSRNATPSPMSLADVRKRLAGAPAKTGAKPAVAKPAAKPVVVKPAAKPAAVKSDTPRRSGMLRSSVGQLQDILNKLGAKLKRDGEWGPKTATAWTVAAKRLKVDGAIDRAGPIEAWVDPAAFKELAKRAGVSQAEPAGQPISAKPAAAPSPAAAAMPSGLEPVTQNQLGIIIRGFRPPIPKKATGIQETWAALAKANKLDGTSSLTKAGLGVVPKTRDELVKRAEVRIAADLIVSQSGLVVEIKAFQEGLKFANQTDAYKGRFKDLTVSGKWGPKTENAFFEFFKIPSGNVAAWRLALKTLVKGAAVKLPANFASQAKAAAENFKKQKKAIAKKEASQAKADKQVAKQAAVDDTQLNARVAQANTILSVFTLQQALSEIRERQKAGTVPGPLLPAIKLTGVWDANTDKALYASFSDAIWGGQTIPKGAWAKLLNRLLVKSASKANLSGLYGVFGDLAAAPNGANYIKLPAAVAQKIQNLAADLVARGAKQGEIRESSDEAVLPSGGGRVAGEPLLVTGQVPQQQSEAVPVAGRDPMTWAPPAPAPVPAPAPAPVTGQQMQVPMIETPEGERVDVNVNTNVAPPAPIILPAQAGSDTPAPISTPDAAAPAAEPPKESSGGLMILLAAVAGAGAVYLLAQGEKEHRDQKRAAAPRRKRR
jgi:hypothetical protein